MSRTFVTCAVHAACQVESRDGSVFAHHSARSQPRSPNAPESRVVYEPMPVCPPYWATYKRWRARQLRKWKRRLHL